MTAPLPTIPAEVWASAAQLPDRPSATDLDALRRTRPDTPAQTWTTAVTQTLLRRRAAAKLGLPAASMWLTDPGLQQASRPAVAIRRARQLAQQESVAALTGFVDLGCGLGIDSIAAARAGFEVTAVESDPTTAAAAHHNLTALSPAGSARVVTADAMTYPVSEGAVAFVDPARRAGTRSDGSARRSTDPHDWQPPWSWLESFTVQHPDTVAKVAPGIDRDLPAPGVAIEWVSVAGDLVEATLWYPGVRADRGRRTATLLAAGPDPWTPGPEHQLSGVGEPAPPGPLRDWLLEPDPAVIRSGLVGDLADQVGAAALSEGIAYLSTEHPAPDHWGRVSRIVAVLPVRPRHLRAELRRLGIGSVEIRTRGLGIDPQRLRRELALPDGIPGSLVLTRIAGRGVGLLVDDPAAPGRRGS